MSPTPEAVVSEGVGRRIRPVLATVGHTLGLNPGLLCCVTLSELLGLSEAAATSLSSGSVFRAQESAKTKFFLIGFITHFLAGETEAEKRTFLGRLG